MAPCPAGEGHKTAKKRLKEGQAAGVAKVIGTSKLRTKYESHEAKRNLCAAYDLFLADERILPSLPKLLGALPPFTALLSCLQYLKVNSALPAEAPECVLPSFTALLSSTKYLLADSALPAHAPGCALPPFTALLSCTNTYMQILSSLRIMLSERCVWFWRCCNDHLAVYACERCVWFWRCCNDQLAVFALLPKHQGARCPCSVALLLASNHHQADALPAQCCWVRPATRPGSPACLHRGLPCVRPYVAALWAHLCRVL